MGDRIVVVKDGLIQQVADPMTLYNRPNNKFVASFIGSPPMNFLTGQISRLGERVFFQSGQFKVRIPPAAIEKILPYDNKEILIGVRPEDIYDKLFASEASADNTVKATCEVVEPMGAEAYLYLKTGTNVFIARVSGHVRPGVNQDLDLVFDMSKAHFFDKATEQAIL